MLTRIYVNRGHIIQNRKDDGMRPVFSLRTYKGVIQCNRWKVVGTLEGIYAKNNPLCSGAMAYLETGDGDIEVIE